MTIPVVWYGNKPGILNRGYWDQAMVEAILDGSLWPPAGRVSFSHHADIEAAMDGAVVVVPARWFAQEVGALNAALRPLQWVFLVLTGDEEGEFPWDQVRHPNLVMWVQTAHPGRHPNTGASGRTRYRWLGDGWPPGTREILADLGPTQPGTPWWFCGQLNNTARENCINALIARRQSHNDGVVKVTRVFGDRRVLSQEQFLALLSEAKVAPCPAGTYSPDTFRVFEALEAGRVPIVDRTSPGTPWEATYWETLFGAAPPFPLLDDWAEFGPALEAVLGEWPAVANRTFAWWQAQKRRTAHDFYDDLGWVANLPAVPTVEDQITVLVPTSPIATHPDLAILAGTIDSVRERLPGSEILVMCDGVRPEQAHRRRDYAEYLRRLTWTANFDPGWRGVLPVIYDEWLHQAEMTRRTLPLVRTPYVLFVEHDTPLMGDTEWTLLAAALDSGQANLIRLHHENRVLEVHKHLMLDDSPRHIAGCRVQATVQWSQRPHLATTDFYRRIINDYFGIEARTMIEDVMYGVLLTHHHQQRMAGWDKFRTFLYTPEGGTIQRSTHTDGRAGEPKYGMLWRYDTPDTPLGAPAPRRDEPTDDPGPSPLCPCVRP